MNNIERKSFLNRIERLYWIVSTNWDMINQEKLQSQHKHELAVERFDAVVYTYRLITGDKASWSEWDEKREEIWQNQYKELVEDGYSE